MIPFAMFTIVLAWCTVIAWKNRPPEPSPVWANPQEWQSDLRRAYYRHRCFDEVFPFMLIIHKQLAECQREIDDGSR